MKMDSGDNRPIGVFDSGLGGLTAVTHMAELLPNERFIYFGDTARTPYGSKAVNTIKKFSLQIADFLTEHDAKIIVIACNTVSATCLELLQEKYPHIPIIGIITPTARKIAAECSEGERVGVIGTKVTVTSGQYEKSIAEYTDKCRVYTKACPLFVPAIEEGIEDTKIMELLVKHYLDDFIKEYEIQTLVLGCTHYPLIEKTVRKLYPTLKIVNPSEVVAYEADEILKQNKMQAEANDSESHFYASDLSEGFVKMVDNIIHGHETVIKSKKFEENIELF